MQNALAIAKAISFHFLPVCGLIAGVYTTLLMPSHNQAGNAFTAPDKAGVITLAIASPK